MFSAHPEDLVLSFDEDLGYSLLGPCMRKNGTPWLRAVDIENRRIGWDGVALDAPSADGASNVVARREMTVRGHTVYVAQGAALVAVDLLTGRERWRATIGDALEWTASRGPGGGCQVAEPFAPEGEGAVAVPTTGRALAAFDRETGRPLWRKSYERRISVASVGVSGAVAVDLDGRVEILRAREGDLVASFGGIDGARVERTAVEGRCVIAVVRDWGPKKRRGVLVVDGATGEVLSFDEAAEARARCVAAGGGRVYAAYAHEDGDRLGFVPGDAPAKKLPFAGATITALRMAGSTLVATLRAAGARRVIGFAAGSLTQRFELVDLGGMPEGTSEDQVQTDGRVLAVVMNPYADRARCEIFAVDAASGAILWRRGAGEWIAHYFLGRHLVVVSRGRLELLEPDTGETFTAYPFG